MHPSPDVWTSISRRLHQRRRKTGFVTGAFLLVTSFLGYLLIENKDVVKPVGVKVIGNTFKSYPVKHSFTEAKPLTGVGNDGSLVFTPAQEFIKMRGTSEHRLSSIAATQQTVETTDSGNVHGDIISSAENFEISIIDSDPVAHASTEPPAVKETQDDVKDNIPTIESVTNAFKPVHKKNKLSFQVFFTPTVSYRKLSENKAYLNAMPQTNATINYAVLYNVNDAVTHKPDMGVELGFTAKYPVSKNMKLRGGVQFNVSRYDIKAFNYPTEVARIALNNSSLGVDYVGAAANYRNFGGGKVDWLQNKYFQLSAPIGAEIKLAGNNNTSFGIAGTVQPTYVLGDRAYMISTDYKNYTEVPWLMRRWNMNTSFETFVAYSTGKLAWQVGPQIRYQVFSSFVTEYPVRENLFDFGLKVGVSLNNTKSSENK